MFDSPPPAVAPALFTTVSLTSSRSVVVLLSTNTVGLLVGTSEPGTEMPTTELPPEIPQLESVQYSERVPSRDSSVDVHWSAGRVGVVPARSKDSETASGYPLELKFAERLPLFVSYDTCARTGARTK